MKKPCRPNISCWTLYHEPWTARQVAAMEEIKMLNLLSLERPAAKAMATIAALMVVSGSYGQSSPADVSHTITWRPRGNIAPLVHFVHFEHAWAREFGPDDADSQTNPAIQPVGYRPYGTNRMTGYGHTIRDGGRKVNQEETAIGAAGTMGDLDSTAQAGPLFFGTTAVARSRVNVPPFGTTGVTATLSFHTSVVALPGQPPERKEGYAFAGGHLRIRARHMDKRGNIRMGRTWRIGRGANAASNTGRVRAIDPITFEITDTITGQTWKHALLHIETAARDGVVEALPGAVVMDGQDAKLYVGVDGLGGGRSELIVIVQGGTVVKSVGTGMFSFANPAMGTAAPVTMALPDTDVDYDFNSLTPNECDITIDAGGGSEIDEPATGMLGMLECEGYTWMPSMLDDDYADAFPLQISQGPTVLHKEIVQPDAFGEFRMDYDGAGLAEMSLNGPTFLRQKLSGVQMGQGGVLPPPIQFFLRNGDCDGDNVVSVFDYILLSDAFDSVPGDVLWQMRADLDGDRAVSIFDYILLSSRFDEFGDPL